MNIFHLLSEIEKVDPEVYERLDSRRRVFQHMGIIGKTLSAAALPAALGAIFNKAYAQTTPAPSVNDVLNFALKLEHLEATFYTTGLGTGTNNSTQQTALRAQLSATNRTALDKIRVDENNHVTFLRGALGTAAAPPPAANEFDFTGGKGSGTGPFATVFTDANVFLAVAQALEDTGVRAYKGGAPLLMSNKTVLEHALNIHSVEARHASRLRTMRRGGPMNDRASTAAITGANRGASPKSWVSLSDDGGPAPAQTAPVYGAGTPATNFPAESNTSQGGIDLATAQPITSLSFPAAAISEAFDEPLDVATVLNIARLFTRTGSTYF